MTLSRSVASITALVLLAAACGDTSGGDPGPAAAPTTAVAPTNAMPPTTVATTPPAEDPGERPTTGAGWRLLTDEAAGRPYEVSVALSATSLARMWEYYGFAAPLPEVDLAHEVVVVLGQAVSGSCPDIRLDDFVVAGDVVFGEFSYPTAEGTTCTADANPHSYVLAVERAALPTSFTLQLTEDLVCGGCDKDELAVDLTDPDLDQELWGFGRILIVRDGPPVVAPDASMGFATPSYGLIRNWVVEAPLAGPYLAHVIEPADGTFILDAGRVDCSAGDCGDDPPPLESPCRAFVDAVPGADVWAVYTVASDGTCTWEVLDAYELPERPDAG